MLYRGIRSIVAGRRSAVFTAPALILCLLSGCYAPLHSPGIEARKLPDEFRAPLRTSGLPLNYASLVMPPPPVYLLGPGDVLDVNIPDLIEIGRSDPFQTSVLETGQIQIPRLGLVPVAGLSLAETQARLVDALAQGFLVDPSVNVTLVQKGTVNVVVLGAVNNPGVQALPRFENDVGHAIAAAGGLAEEAGEIIEIHRRNGPAIPFAAASPATTIRGQSPAPASRAAETAPDRPTSLLAAFQSSHSVGAPQSPPVIPADFNQPEPLATPPIEPPANPSLELNQVPFHVDPIVRIPLRGADPAWIQPDMVLLGPGDVIVVPHRTQQVFYVVGQLSEVNRTRFTVGDRDREIGNGFVLPPDREIDVVTAVAMAGFIDPIDSPTTVTVHRVQPDGRPLLVHVDLIRARTDARENILIQPGDIVYLNPDCWWYSRRLVDRVIGGVLGSWLAR